MNGADLQDDDDANPRPFNLSGRKTAISPSGRLIPYGPDPSASQRRRRRRRVRSLALIPSLLTFSNGICGFVAIFALARAYTNLQLSPRNLDEAGNQIAEACIFIGLGMLFDMLDGKVARLTGTAGRFGAELDSLCDVVTFGVAPALMLRVFGEATFGTGMNEPPTLFIRLLWGVSALYLAAGLFRLARFNVETASDDDHFLFRGLPIPAGAGGVVSLFLFSWHFMGPKDGTFPAADTFAVLVPAFGILLSLLMVSRIKYHHVFNRLLSRGRSVPQVLLIPAGLVILYIVAADHILPVLAGVFIVYVLSGPLLFGWTRTRRSMRLAAVKSARARAARSPAATEPGKQGN